MIEDKNTDSFRWLWIAVGCFLLSAIFLAYYIDKEQNIWLSKLFQTQTQNFLDNSLTNKNLKALTNLITNHSYHDLHISLYKGESLTPDTLIVSNINNEIATEFSNYPTNLSYIKTFTSKNNEVKTIALKPGLTFLKEQNRALPIFIIIGGFVLSIFSFLNLIILRRSKVNAELIAFEKTAGLLRSEAYFRTAMEASSIGMAIVGTDGSWLKVNSALCRILKYSPKELLNMDFQTITHPDDIDKDLQLVNKLLNGDMDTYQMEKRYFRKDKKIIWALLSVAIIRNDDGTPRHFISQIHDITTVKKTQEKLQTANAELEEFSYRTSHDLRSPLVSSITLLDIAKKSLETNKIEKTLKSINLTQNSLVKLEALVQDILLLTQTKNMQEDRKEIDVSNFIEESLKKFSHMTDFDRLDIQKNLQFTDPLNVKVSRFRLIIENLISNAIKYQDTEKEHSFIKITTHDDNQFFILSIEDNGLGIPEKHHKQLFSMFKRFHTKVAFGSGLGLYMVKKSADIIDAELTFKDSGNGCIFELKLPLNRRKVTHEH